MTELLLFLFGLFQSLTIIEGMRIFGIITTHHQFSNGVQEEEFFLKIGLLFEITFVMIVSVYFKDYVLWTSLGLSGGIMLFCIYITNRQPPQF